MSSQSQTLMSMLFGFAIGCIVCTTVILSLKLEGPRSAPLVLQTAPSITALDHQQRAAAASSEAAPTSILNGVRIFIAIAAFDFAQLPHFEEVLDSYSDLCASGALVDVIIHATVPYPITLIDLLNTRLTCVNPAGRFTVTISLVSPGVRLHLVDIHRPLFYEKLEEYDLFIYTEDDIRVSPRTVASYLHETKVLQDKVGYEKSFNYNVGLVRYEYNFPTNVLMDDKTRHVTENVTRVYWEHSYQFPAFPKVVDVVPDLDTEYVHMKNHHQGMFLATRDLLKAWKKRCQFDVVTDRPGGHSQPSEGTQRVWMSSQQLYAPKHCGVQQVIPFDHFGSLTVLHLPNKNYRRVGHFRNRTFSDGKESFDMGAQLLTAMGLHMEMRAINLGKPHHPYRGAIVSMEDKIDRSMRWGRELNHKFSKEDYLDMVDRRIRDFDQYVSRGGVLAKEDLTKTALVDVLPAEQYREGYQA